jgi:hypothetical protein
MLSFRRSKYSGVIHLSKKGFLGIKVRLDQGDANNVNIEKGVKHGYEESSWRVWRIPNRRKSNSQCGMRMNWCYWLRKQWRYRAGLID